MDINKLSTEEFVNKIKDDQKQAEKNKQRQGNNHPEKKLPNNQSL